MLCQNCKKNEATTHIKTIVNGEATEAHLCSDCAKSLGYDGVFSDFGFNFSDMLSSFFSEPVMAGLGGRSLRCDKCGSTFNDIVRSGKIGCGDCYSTFYDKLLPSLERLHGRTSHEGKIPNCIVEVPDKTEKEKLQDELDEAVKSQDYEKAAELRDKIKGMESEGK